MGKDTSKSVLSNSNSTSRLYSPWQLDDNENVEKKEQRKFGLFDNFVSFMDDDLVNTIQLIEKEQRERIERNREEDSILDEGGISSNIGSLGISNFSSNSMLDPQKVVPFTISSEDQALVDILTVPESQQTILVTLERAVLSNDPTDLQCSLSASNPKVVQVYKKIGDSLARYKSGRVPKALKIIPSLPNWDAVLCLSNPTKWSPQATFEVTRIFLTNIKATQTKQYFQFVLLPSVRSNLIKNKQQFLDTPLYLALQKGMTSCPALFLKGFLFPLLESNSCTLAEASLLGSIIQHARIPSLHTATALMRLSEILLFTLPISILVLSFLGKLQALPYRVVDSLVIRYFCQRKDEIVLPMIWYKSLHIFVKSYGMDLVPTQKGKLLDLIHHVKKNNMTSVIVETLQCTSSKFVDEDEVDSDDTNQTLYCEGVYDYDSVSNASSDEMAVD